MINKYKYLASASPMILLVLASVAPPSAAFAQTASANVEEIVVTGTRIPQNGFKAPTPVTVVTAAALVAADPGSLSLGLRQLPQLTGSGGAVSGPSPSSNAAAAGGGTYLNLRNLGSQRNLVLQDAHRLPANRPDGQFDVNLVPQMLVKQVDIVTGGASAVYGSDAVAGVINFITDTSYRGVKGVVQGGMAELGDYRNYHVGLAAGRGFANDRIHVIGSVERQENRGIHDLCDRRLGCLNLGGGGKNGPTNVGTLSNPLTRYENVTYSTATFGGNVISGPAALVGQRFTDAGTFVPYLNKPEVYAGTTCINCEGATYIPQRETLVPATKTTSAFLRSDVYITDTIKAWVQGAYSQNTFAQSTVAQYGLGNITIFNGNAFLPAAAQAALVAAGPTSSLKLAKIWTTIPNAYFASKASTKNVAAGLNGSLIKDFKWDVYASYGKSESAISGTELNTKRYFAALDAVRDASGAIVCRITVTNPGELPGCLPLNPFGENTASPAAVAYAQGNYKFVQATTMSDVSANLHGSLFDLPAGPVGFNIGAEYRKSALHITSDNVAPDLSHVRSPSTTLQNLFNNVQPSSGSYSVKEAYGELAVPILHDVPFARLLDFSGAARYTDYSVSGKVTTWKAGLAWAPIDDVRFRGAISRDIRAPTLNDLFAPLTFRNAGFTDPHTGIAGVVTNVTGGNTSLRPEVAKTITYGIILSPQFMPGFTMSVDSYSITLTGAIASPYSAAQIDQFCEDSNGADAFFCSRIIRPLPFSNRTSANYPTQIIGGNANVAKVRVKGVDVEAAYTTDLAGGRLSARVLGNWQPKNESKPTPSSVVTNNAGFGSQPRLKGQAQLSYKINDFTILFRERFVGAVRLDQTYVTDIKSMDPVFYSDLNVSKTFQVEGKKFEVFLNINNLLDKQAPFVLTLQTVPGFQYPSNGNIYDLVGRQYTVGVKFDF
jgi:iron complex outermembrane receptor protein